MQTTPARFRRLILFSVLILLISGVSGAVPVNAGSPRQDIPTVDPVLLSRSKISDSLDYLIYFEEEADLSAAYDLPWEERGWFVVDTLTRHADENQARVRHFLDVQGVTYQSFWAENAIMVEASTGSQMQGLLIFTEIQSLQSLPQVMLVEPISTSVDETFVETKAVTSNLTQINADDVWAMGYDGTGMVVGSIDTGVRYTHDALEDQYRGNLGGDTFDHNYSWWDAVGGKKVPYDDVGHGSHVTGIMVGSDGGSNQIGVAPGAEWIACKAFSPTGGYGSDLLECGQFMLAPWDLTESNAQPSKRPHVVNNSWGNCDQAYDPWFENTIDAWVAAGIYPVFANGNASGCGYSLENDGDLLNKVGNPARSYHVTAVGSTGNSDGQYATHSNWGPTDSLDTLNPNGYSNLKPQVVAPGVSIRSAVGNGDSAYAYYTGTSMSAPHVAGLVALVWQSAPHLLGNYVQTETLLQNTAAPIPYATNNGDEGPGNVPNHATGWGEIDALAAVKINNLVELTGKLYLPMFIH